MESFADTNDYTVISDNTSSRPFLRIDYLSSIKILCWSVALLIGICQVAANHFTINPDGLSYVDIADAYARGDWGNAINAYWSPLYSWLIAINFLLVRPTPEWEFTTVHILNVLIYFGTLASFEYFLRSISSYQLFLRQNNPSRFSDNSPLPEWIIQITAYALFIWCSISLITTSMINPDLLVALIVYLAAGLSLRLSISSSTKGYVLLGLLLGFGFLAKAALLPIALVFIAAGLLSPQPFKDNLKRSVLTLSILLLVIAPFVAAISIQKGRFTLGDTGKLNYSWCVNGNKIWMYWQGGYEGSGTPIHPVRRINTHPEIYEFAEPVGGTFPLWYDPSYWYEGVKIYFDPVKQINRILMSLGAYVMILFDLRSGRMATVFFLVLLCLAGSKKLLWHNSKHSLFLLPALSALGLYSLVFVETRYVGAFLVLIFLSLLYSFRAPEGEKRKLVLKYCAVIFPLTLVVTTAFDPPYRDDQQTWPNAYKVFTGELNNDHWEVGRELNEIGLKRGDRIAFVSTPVESTILPGWARLAGLKLISTMPTPAAYWYSYDSIHPHIERVFLNTQARAILTDNIPLEKVPPGWTRVGQTEFYAYMLR